MPKAPWLLALVAGCAAVPPEPPPPPPPPSTAPVAGLRPAAAFASIADPVDRAHALFEEASKVMLHPRCVNCHPSGDSPRQGDASLRHAPVVSRGEDDRGVVGMQCDSCHQDRNLAEARVPGAPGWHLAPRSMAWEGGSPASICEQLKDPERNGGRTLAAVVDHGAHDRLVAWGFDPGHDRTPAPGDQATFGGLLQAWVDAGAACPPAMESTP